MKKVMRLAAGLVLVSLVSGCGGEGDPGVVAPEEETSTLDTSIIDSARPDTQVADTNVEDTTVIDTTVVDTTVAETTSDVTTTETTLVDTALADTAVADTAVADTKVADTAVADTAVVDTTVADTAVADTAVADTAVADTAVADTAVADTAVADSAIMCTAELPGPACNTIPMPASATFVTGTVGTIPTFTEGGTYPPGVYVLVKEIINSGTPGTRKEVFLTTGTCLQDYSIKSDGSELRANAALTSSGGMETFAFTCPFVATVTGAKYGIKGITGGKYTIITLGTAGASQTYREWVQQ